MPNKNKRIKGVRADILSSSSVGQRFLIEKLRKTISSQEKAIKQIKKQLEVFLNISTLLTLGPSLEDVLKDMFQKTKKRTKSSSIAILLLDEKKEFFDLAAHYLLPEVIVEAYKKFRVRVDRGAAGMVFKTKKPYLMKDALTDPHAIQSYVKLVKRSGLPARTLLTFPLIIKNEVIGTLIFFFPRPKQSIPRFEFIIFSTIANQLASFIQNSKIYRELQQRIEQLEKINKLTVGRELIMRELKNEIKKLEEELEKCQKTNPQN